MLVPGIVRECRGVFFCQWDDDDWYHVNRITVQMEAVLRYVHPVAMMTNWLLFDDSTGQAYFSSIRLWEGSILCKKELVNAQLNYPHCQKARIRILWMTC
jgi:hypothetical protein